MKIYCRTFDNESFTKALFSFTEDYSKLPPNGCLVRLTFSTTFQENFIDEYIPFLMFLVDTLKEHNITNIDHIKKEAIDKYCNMYAWHYHNKGASSSMTDAFIYLSEICQYTKCLLADSN